MKYFQFISPGATLRDVVEQNFSPLQHILRTNKGQAIKESSLYMRDQKTNRFDNHVRKGAAVTVLTPQEIISRPVFVLNKAHIAFDDGDLVVFDKPEKLDTQPPRDRLADHLYGAAIVYFTKLKPMKLAYIGLHHRLDRDTSGLVLMTRKTSMNKSIAEQFQNREIQKTYHAVVTGPKPPQPEWVEYAPIGRLPAPRGVFLFGVDKKKGDPAETHFRFLESFDKDTHLIECKPVTGRTHQIRIHLLKAGIPILGDTVYGPHAAANKKAGDKMRMYLHASELEFRHPKTNEMVKVKSKKEFQP